MDFNNFPQEILLYITNSLDSYDIISLSKTCKSNNNMIKSIFKKYMAIYRKSDVILIIENSDPNFDIICKNLKYLQDKKEEIDFNVFRFLTPYNETFVIDLDFRCAKRDPLNCPKRWSSGEYIKYVESLTITKSKKEYIFQNKQLCIDFLLDHSKTNLIDLFEKHNIALFAQNSDYDGNPKTKEEFLDQIKNCIELENKFWFNSGNSHYNVQLLKFDTSCTIKLSAKGYWNYLIGKISKQKKFKKKNKEKYDRYITHNNGCRPFIIFKNKKTNKVSIYRHMYLLNLDDRIYKKIYNKKILYDIKVQSYTVKRLLVGEDERFPGNSVLLDLGNSRYVFIGHCIYEFSIEADDEIINYFSEVGNSDVPYPVAISRKNAYFMLYKEYLPKDDFPENISWYHQAYTFFYGHNRNEKMVGKPFMNIENIHHNLNI